MVTQAQSTATGTNTACHGRSWKPRANCRAAASISSMVTAVAA
jgi:hypothetical protein